MYLMWQPKKKKVPPSSVKKVKEQEEEDIQFSFLNNKYMHIYK